MKANSRLLIIILVTYLLSACTSYFNQNRIETPHTKFEGIDEHAINRDIKKMQHRMAYSSVGKQVERMGWKWP